MKKSLLIYTAILLVLACAAGYFMINQPSVKIDLTTVQTEIYVDPDAGSDDNDGLTTATPFKNIEKARDYVRTINRDMTGNIFVYLMPGTYCQSAEILLAEQDSGTNGFYVQYKAHDMSNQPILTGGKTVTDWELFDSEKNIYKTAVLPEDDFRQIYVDGEKAVRARSPEFKPPGRSSKDGFKTADLTMQNWQNKDKIELVCHPVDWQITRLLASDIVGDNIFISSDPWRVAGAMYIKSLEAYYNNNVIYYENAFELLDEEGEWYLDSAADALYYKPAAGQNMATVTVEVPVADTIFNLLGSSGESFVSNIRFEGLQFTKTNWTAPSYYSHVGEQGSRFVKSYDEGMQGITHLPAAALQISYARNIDIERCAFIKTGAIGVRLMDGSQHCTIRGSVFYKTCADGIYFKTTNEQEQDENVLIKHLTIDNNYIYSPGEDYKMAAGIFCEVAQYVDITHNFVENTPYTGIEVYVNVSSDVFENSRGGFNVSYNHVKDTLTTLSDGGAIYTTNPSSRDSKSSRSKIMYNYIQNSGDEGLYTDNRSEYWEVAHNVCESIKNSWMNMWHESIHDEYWHDNYTNTTTEVTNGTNCVIKNTTYFQGTDYPSGAVAIIEKSGLENEYADILQLVRG